MRTIDDPWTLPAELAPQPGTPAADPAALDIGRRLFAGPCDFVTSAPHMGVLPELGPAEIAFAGRSNVGKSSLVNALTGRNTLARTSNTPGRTQALNFFDLGGALRLVDLPGYGYAKAPKEAVRDWTDAVFAYLRGRPRLMRVMLLIDSRHGIKPNDEEAMNILDSAAAVYQVVLTKTDKLKPAGVPRLVRETAAKLDRRPAAHPLILPTSSEKGWGLAQVRAEIAAVAAV